MNKKLLTYFIFLISTCSFSQKIYTEYGSTISSFDYINSNGNSLSNLLPSSKSYFGAGYRQSINPKRNLFLNLGISYNGYGAIGSESSVDNFFEWDVSYFGIKGGLEYKFLELRDLMFFVNGSVASEFLIRGNQTINNDVYNLVGEEEFNNNILFLRAGLRIQYPISNKAAIYIGYNYGKSVLISSGENAEKLNLIAHQFGIGFIINLPKCYCDF